MLLAILAVSAERGMARERLAELLWPDAQPESGRHDLDQTLHVLRRCLGRDLIVGPDPLRLSPDAVSVDLWEFESLAGTDPVAAGALVRGEFLDGFRTQGVPGFQRWLEATRDEIGVRVRAVLTRSALALEAEGRLTEAESAWRQVAARDEFSPAAQAGIARCLSRRGERVAAERRLDLWQAMLSREMDPSSAERLLGPVRAALATPPDPESSRPETFHPAEPRVEGDAARREPSRPWPWAVVMLTVVAGAAVYSALRSPVRSPPRDENHVAGATVMIEPFTAGSGVDPGLARAFTELVLGTVRAAGYSAEPAALASAAGSSATVLHGSVTAEAGRETIEGSLVRPAQAPVIILLEGRANAETADELVARLLTAGDADLEAEMGRGTRPSAMIAFLNGRQALVRDDPESTLRAWRRALELDSTFATAALMLFRLSQRTDGLDEPRAVRLAWADRASLRPLRRRLLEILWAHYLTPVPRAFVASLQNLAGANLSDPVVWEELGSAYESMGAVAGVANPLAEARQAYARAFSLDSTLWLASGRLEELAAIAGDTLTLQRVWAQADPGTHRAGLAREMTWAFTRRDRPRLDRLRARLPELRPLELWGVRRRALVAGFDLESADSAQLALLHSARDERQRVDAAWGTYELALNEGRPAIAARMASDLMREWSEETRLALRGLGALYWQDASDSARVALAWLRDFGRKSTDVPAAPDGRLLDALCAAEQARLDAGDHTIAPRTLRRLTSSRRAAWPPWLRLAAAQCAAFLAVRLQPDSGPGRRIALERLDSLATRGVGCWCLAIHDVTAREWARLGDPARALRALRRRSPLSVRLLAPAKRDEGGWALAVGDTGGALRAWRHYLALRFDPEPGLRPERDSVLQRYSIVRASVPVRPSVDRGQ